MTATDASRDAALAGRTGQFRLTRHARERMFQRSMTRRDIMRALATATTLTRLTKTKWRVDGGVDLDGEQLSVLLAFQEPKRIVTIF
jgi:hypothetical protein